MDSGARVSLEIDFSKVQLEFVKLSTHEKLYYNMQVDLLKNITRIH